MKKVTLPIHPRDASQKILRILPNRRLRDVIEKRYGLVSGKKEETLEAIGKGYGITRERVRQIEADALKRLSHSGALDSVRPLLASFSGHLDEHGGAAEEGALFNSMADARLHPHLNLLLALAPGIDRRQEDDHHHHRWYTKKEALDVAEAVLKKTVEGLSAAKRTVSEDNLSAMLKENSRSVSGQAQANDVLDSYLGLSKLIKKNPYGEFGLIGWPEISPSGVRDKAHLALVRYGNPLHFRDVAKFIDKAGWSKKRTHPQTVHNELIKDNRFVLVGRGLYALKEWGYEAGTVADVIVSTLKAAGSPLDRRDIIKRVLEKREVKENTILLNLQNKKLFKKLGKEYSLA